MNEASEFVVVDPGGVNVNPVSLSILAVLILIALALFIAGVVARRRKGTTQPFGWLVRQLALLIFMAGFAAFAWEKCYCQFHAARMPVVDPGEVALWQFRTYTQLGLYMAGACLSMIMGIILGPPKIEKTESPTTA